MALIIYIFYTYYELWSLSALTEWLPSIHERLRLKGSKAYSLLTSNKPYIIIQKNFSMIGSQSSFVQIANTATPSHGINSNLSIRLLTDVAFLVLHFQVPGRT
ncbi:Translation machinery-associated protein 64 [Fusarium oxysporum f. sp. albedinis]|nr:Translation machinery-associated protein 64 [Fusarium oxysporum f. sp. albedinis]